jgi:class 3 adenylate cyclase
MAYMEIIEGGGRGNIIRLTGETPIGRAIEHGISLSDSEVSRHHALIRTKDNYFVVMDCGSANGTSINGRALYRFVPQPLYEGDVIEICSTKLKFVSEGQDPLALKKAASGAMMTFGELSKPGGAGGLSMVLTSETRFPTVSATMDASRSVLEAGGSGVLGEEDLQGAVQRLQAMVTVSNNLSALTKPEALLEKIMESIFDVFPQADRAFIMLRDSTGKELAPAFGRSRNRAPGGQEDFPISRTIINAVLEKKQSILSSDAQTDGRFSARQSIVNLSIRSLMCAPFICKDELLGIISIDTVSNARTFNSQDLSMLTSIAGQAAIALKNADLFVAIEKETHVRAQLSRYLSKDVVEGVIDGTIPLQLGAEKKNGTVFFCDIVGFTAIAERLSAVEVVEKLNRYFRITTEIITRNKGTLHKFGGDMIMAFWNVMLPDAYAQVNAIRASVEMQTAIWKFDCRLNNSGQSPLYLGIGCNTGEFAGGNVGGEDRMEYTIIGDNVNLAQRIESLASRWQVFVAESTYEPAALQCCAIKLPPAQVKGKSSGILVYSVRGIQCDPGKMLLTIPVALIDETREAPGSGMLVQFNNSEATLQLFVADEEKITGNGPIVMEFDFPELSKRLRLEGAVRSMTPLRQDEGGISIILENLSGTDALSFLKPGCCIESDKAWEEMKRH